MNSEQPYFADDNRLAIKQKNDLTDMAIPVFYFYIWYGRDAF